MNEARSPITSANREDRRGPKQRPELFTIVRPTEGRPLRDGLSPVMVYFP